MSFLQTIKFLEIIRTWSFNTYSIRLLVHTYVKTKSKLCLNVELRPLNKKVVFFKT